MRKLVCLVLFAAACDLQPAPKQERPSPSSAPPSEAARPVAPPPAPAPAPAATADTGAAAPVVITPACMDVATKIVQVFIDNAEDTAQKSSFEQVRSTMVRKTGEACTQQGWSAEARSCYTAAKTPAAIKACERKLTPPPSAQPPAAPPSRAIQ